MEKKIKSTNYLITPHRHFIWQGTRSSDGSLYLQGSWKAEYFWTWSQMRAHTHTHTHIQGVTGGMDLGRVFLMLNYTDITQNTYIQSWTVTEITDIEKCGFLWCPRTVSRPWRHIHPLRMPGNEKPLANIGMQWRRDNAQLLPASITWKPKNKCDSMASVFVVQFNGFMSLTS